MRARITIAAVGAIAALVVASAAAPRAQAMAMYNNSTYYQGGSEVRFMCGFFCGWFSKGMPYHEQVAYPGKGGSFQLIQDGCTMSSGHPNIEDHGFAELIGADLNSDSEGIQWNMWGNSGNVISGSPFNVVCFPSPERPQLASASRAPGPAWISRQFHAWDADRDGALSNRELRAGANRDFRQADLNGDGVVDARDVRKDLQHQSAARHRAGQTALAFDLDGDGKASSSEYWRYVRRTFVAPSSHGHKGPLTLDRVRSFYAASGVLGK